MPLGEVLHPESPGVHHRHRQGVAHDQRGGGAGGRGQVEGAGLLGHVAVQDHVRMGRQGRLLGTGEGDDLDPKSLQGRQQVDQFLRLPGIAEGEHHVAVVEDPEVPVQGIHGVENDGRGAGAAERRGDLPSDGPRFPDPGDDEFSASAEGGDDDFHGPVEGGVERGPDGFERGDLDGEDVAGTRQVGHGGVCSVLGRGRPIHARPENPRNLPPTFSPGRCPSLRLRPGPVP